MYLIYVKFGTFYRIRGGYLAVKKGVFGKRFNI